MSVREYIGARYVPVFATPLEWDSSETYEPLTIVYHQGNSYTSRQAVPTGIDITNETYWALTGNYNAQIEAYRHEVETYRQDVESYNTRISNVENKFDSNGKLEDDVVVTDSLTDECVTTDKLSDGSVTTVKIADENVTTEKLADENVTTAKLADECVTTAKLDDGSVTTVKIADENVTTDKIADENVTTAKLADECVTTAKLDDECVTNSKIENGAITKDKLNLPTLVKYPIVVGREFFPSSSTNDFSCVVKHENLFYGFAPYNNTSNSVEVRLYNLTANTITTRPLATVGHANSCCFNENTNRVLVVWAGDHSTGSYVWSNNMSVFDSSLNFINTIALSDIMKAITFDSVSKKLYALSKNNTDSSGEYANLYELDSSNYNILSTVKIENIPFDPQDMCINGDYIYLSKPTGEVFYSEMKNINFKLLGNIGNTDANQNYTLGEMEGIEFDEDNTCIAAYRCSLPNGTIGFTTEIINPKLMMNTNTSANIRSISASNEYQTKWHKLPYQLASINEVNCLKLLSPSRIDIADGFEEPAKEIAIFIPISINIAGASKVVKLSPMTLSNELCFFNEGNCTIQYASGVNTAPFVVAYFQKARLTYNNTGTFTDGRGSGSTVNVGANKNLQVIANLGSGTTFNLDGQTAVANSIYLAPSVRIHA